MWRDKTSKRPRSLNPNWLFEVAQQQNDYLVALIGMHRAAIACRHTKPECKTKRSAATLALQGIDKNLAKRGMFGSHPE